MTNQLCIAYAAGPGDVVNTFKYWQKGEDDPQQVAITYSGQFFDLCKRLGARGIVLSSNQREGLVKTDQFHVENIPSVPSGKGVGFHYRQIQSSVEFLRRSRALGAKIFVISDATGHWFPFSLMKHPDEKIIPTLHCVLWSRFRPLTKVRRVLNALENKFFRKDASGILCVSRAIASQAKEVAQLPTLSPEIFNPVYRTDTFNKIAPPPAISPHFSLFFAGRLESEKGIFDLLQIAKNLKTKNISDVQFNILGNGSAELRLRHEVERSGVEEIFKIHGYCERQKVLELLGRSHVIIVPTSTQFHEGFNKVVAEGIMAGRPVITSSACPALHSVREAVVEVPPDDTLAYERAILQLKNNRMLYQAKQRACKDLSEQFYNLSNSWGQRLESILQPDK